MRLWKKGFCMMIGAALLSAALAGSAFAAENRTKISSVSLTVDSNIEVGEDSGEVNVSTTSSHYDVTDVSVVNDEGEWVGGDVPRIEVTLEADDDYYFAAMSKSKVTLKGDDATYVTSHREDSNSTLVVTIKLDALEGSLEIEDVSWDDDNSPVATWDSLDGAHSYQVRLYRGESSVGTAVTTTNQYYNFSSSITREGEYYFKVRAVGNNSKKGDWYESDYIYVDDQMLAAIRSGAYSYYNNNSGTSGSTQATPGTQNTVGGWKRNNIGWWYEYSDGSYPVNGWTQINNIWYCFDASGYMRVGWIQAADGNWYYCDPREGSNQGAMLTNTRTPDNYYVDANGIWIPGR